MNKIQCTIFRGGTSKGIFILEENLPKNKSLWENILLKLMGSPSVSQINGLGGATSTTSKVAIISKEEKEEWDINYTFAQVAIRDAVVTYKGNCGNISSAVGPYAIEKGLIEAKEGETKVRVYNTNTKKIIEEYIKTPNKQVEYEGEFKIPGVEGTGEKITLAFKNPSGSMTGRLLPTGNNIDILDVPGYKKIEVSIVDSANSLVFVRGRDINLTGRELPDEIDKDKELVNLLEKIRGVAAVKLGFIDNYKDSRLKSPSVPKMTIVEESKDYKDVNGELVKKEDIDILGRMMSMQLAHKTYALTGALCTVSAALIEGTIVNELAREDFNPLNFRIGNPAGVMIVGGEKDKSSNISVVYGYRTARILMDGVGYY
ncbi:MAG: 2-methylaconitate cis-trans isomerase PrpF family protein [Clostridium sp.]